QVFVGEAEVAEDASFHAAVTEDAGEGEGLLGIGDGLLHLAQVSVGFAEVAEVNPLPLLVAQRAGGGARGLQPGDLLARTRCFGRKRRFLSMTEFPRLSP
ncbi:MAG: hypothetical protein WCF84_08940, partial [Anaerolineae bacterium]